MLTVTVELLHGAIRAGSPDDTVMAGGEQAAEWPPSPARLFSALVAADGTRDRCAVTSGEELAAIEAAPAPVIFADALADTESTHLVSRFVVKDVAETNVVQNYPARSSAEVRPGTRLSPHHPVITYAWDVDVSDADLDSLRRRAARVGYLGCADSPVRVTVTDATPTTSDLPATWHPGATGGTSLPVPYPGLLEHLDDAFDRWSSGEGARRSWIPTRRERYATQSEDDQPAQPTTLWLTFDRRVAGHKVLLVTETLRAAVVAHYDGGTGNSTDLWRLNGHEIPDDATRPYQLARFLALPNVGHDNSDGMIHGAAIWLPPEADPVVVEGVRTALYGPLRELRAPGLQVELTHADAVRAKWTTRPERWAGPSRRWFSATPVVAERGRRKGPTPSDIRSWFRHAGHPEPETAVVSPVPTGSGVVRLRGDQAHRAGKDRHPYYWLDVTFAEPVHGPLTIGRSRSFGLGLLAPAPRSSPSPSGETSDE